jgi:hypothetical protein
VHISCCSERLLTRQEAGLTGGIAGSIRFSPAWSDR